MLRKARIGNVLAPANNCLRTRQAPQFGPQSKRPIECAGEATQFFALSKETAGRFGAPARGASRRSGPRSAPIPDLRRQLVLRHKILPELMSAENRRPARGHSRTLASQQFRQFCIRHQMETACQVSRRQWSSSLWARPCEITTSSSFPWPLASTGQPAGHEWDSGELSAQRQIPD